MTAEGAAGILLPDGRARLLVAASWDPRHDTMRDAAPWRLPLTLLCKAVEALRALALAIREKTSLAEAEKRLGFDVDLFARLEDASGAPVALVGPLENAYIDASGKVYHSGDDEAGEGAGDDEQIFVEYSDLPANIFAVTFAIYSDCVHPLKDVKALSVRVASAAAADSFFSHVVAGDGRASGNFMAFARIARAPDGGWRLQRLDDFAQITEIREWAGGGSA